MNVREMIEMLSQYDPASRVVLEYDTHFFDIKAVRPQVILTRATSWADYPGEEVLGSDRAQAMLSPEEQQDNLNSPRETAIAIWGTNP